MSFEQLAEIIRARACVRSFESQVLDIQEIVDLLTIASRAPSSKNTQPWKIKLVQGQTLDSLRADYLQAFEQGQKPNPDYEYSIEPQTDEWKARARQVGFALFGHKGIGREDKDKMREHYKGNYAFFDAPQVLFLTVRNDAGLGNFLDLGMFLGNVLNGITAKGWGACPSMAAAHFPEYVRKNLCLDSSEIVVCGIPFGIINKNDPVNDFRTIRADSNEWLTTYV